MNFHEFGNKSNPHIMLIHGGGNAWWNFLRQARILFENYHVILPTLDGHGEEFAANYISTEDSADKLMAYIEENCSGHLFALCGVSLGGQIVMELLSRKKDLTKKAIIDGCLCYPQPMMARYCIAAVRLCWGLLFSERACRFQIKSMHKMLPEKMCYPEEIETYYMQDIPHLRKETLLTIYRTYMMQYTIKNSVQKTTAQVMYWYGQKEMKCVKNSAKKFKSYVPTCQIYEAKSYSHGYLSIYLPDEWLEIAIPFFEQNH